MNNKKLMWILLAVIIVFAGFNIFTFFNNRQNYEQVEFSATYTFEKGLKTEIENTVLFSYEKESDLKESLEYFNGVSNEETNVVTGMVREKGSSYVTGFGENRLELQEDSNSKLVFIFPEDVSIISAIPEPTEKVGNVLTWRNVGEIKFPNVEYK